MRAVLDVNVLISATLSARGAPAHIVRAWRNGGFELIVSPLLLEELQRAFSYPKIRERITTEESHQLVRLLEHEAIVGADPDEAPAACSPDPGDDYLLALAASARAALVSQDQHLLSLRERYPLRTPLEFVRLLDGID